jgi:antitoxin HicB
MPNKHIGSTFTSFLDAEGIREEVDLLAKKKVLADEMVATMKRKSVTRTELAKRMKTSRTQINRLLDPDDISVTFVTLAKASSALDLNLLVSLEPRRSRTARHRRR